MVLQGTAVQRILDTCAQMPTLQVLNVAMSALLKSPRLNN